MCNGAQIMQIVMQAFGLMPRLLMQVIAHQLNTMQWQFNARGEGMMICESLKHVYVIFSFL